MKDLLLLACINLNFLISYHTVQLKLNQVVERSHTRSPTTLIHRRLHEQIEFRQWIDQQNPQIHEIAEVCRSKIGLFQQDMIPLAKQKNRYTNK